MQHDDRLPLSEEDLALIEQMRSGLLERGVLTYLPFQAKMLIETEIPLLLEQIRVLQRRTSS
jgi:hypothetical protein